MDRLLLLQSLQFMFMHYSVFLSLNLMTSRGRPASTRFTWIHFPTEVIALRAVRVCEPINRVCMSKLAP
jgi:hypothetical protein